jgi:hypothetical protein
MKNHLEALLDRMHVLEGEIRRELDKKEQEFFYDVRRGCRSRPQWEPMDSKTGPQETEIRYHPALLDWLNTSLHPQIGVLE